MHLALDDHRIDAGAAIVEGVEAADLVDAGIDVDIHDADIGAERIGHVGRIVIAYRLEARFHAGRHGVVGCPADVLHGHGLFRKTLHPEAVDVPFEIVLVHLELVGGDHLRLGLDLARCRGDRRASYGR